MPTPQEKLKELEDIWSSQKVEKIDQLKQIWEPEERTDSAAVIERLTKETAPRWHQKFLAERIAQGEVPLRKRIFHPLAAAQDFEEKKKQAMFELRASPWYLNLPEGTARSVLNTMGYLFEAPETAYQSYLAFMGKTQEAERGGISGMLEQAKYALPTIKDVATGAYNYAGKDLLRDMIPPEEGREHEILRSIGGVAIDILPYAVYSLRKAVQKFRSLKPFNEAIDQSAKAAKPRFPKEADKMVDDVGKNLKKTVNNLYDGNKAGARKSFAEAAKGAKELAKYPAPIEGETIARLPIKKEPAVALNELTKSPSLADYVLKRPKIHAPEVIAQAKKIKSGIGISEAPPASREGEVAPEAVAETPKAPIEAEKAAEKALPKEPWEMKQKDYMEDLRAEFYKREKMGRSAKYSDHHLTHPQKYAAKKAHEALIKIALSEGYPVPAEVLAEYPELQKPKEKIKGLKAEVEEAKESGFIEIGAAYNAIVRKAKSVKDTIGKGFVPHYDIKEFPNLQNKFRLSQAFPARAFHAAVQMQLKPFSIVKNHLKDYKLYNDYIRLQNYLARANQGLTLPEGETVEKVVAELKELDSKMTDRAKRAVEIHKENVRKIAEDAAKRGVMDISASENNPYYMPHYVEDFETLFPEYLSLPQKWAAPFRAKFKEAKGSLRPIETDLNTVMTRYYARYYLDNLVEDMLYRDILTPYDLLTPNNKSPDPTPAELAQMFGTHINKKGDVVSNRPKPNHPYKFRGKWYYAYQPVRGRTFYRTNTISDTLIDRAVERDLTAADMVDAEMFRPGLAMGKARKMYLLEEPIYRKLQRTLPPRSGEIMRKISHGTTIWKRTTLLAVGLAHDIGNLLGDIEGLFRTDVMDILKMPEAAIKSLGDLSTKIKESPEFAAAMEQDILAGLAHSQEIRAGITRPVELEPDPIIRAIRTLNPIRLIWKAREYRESIPRVAKWLGDLERIKAGKEPSMGGVSAEGLSKIDAAGKANRINLIDYGNMTREGSFLRDIFWPFATFYVKNFFNWARYLFTHPIKFTLKVGAVYGGMWAYNNLVHPDVEASLPEWLRWTPHINTGYKNDKGEPYIVSFQTAFQQAANWVGLQKFPDKITKIKEGRLTYEQAAKEQLEDTIKAPVETSLSLLHPFWQMLIGIGSNQDPWTKRKIVPERYVGNPEKEREYQAQYVLGKFFVPLEVWNRAEYLGRKEEEYPTLYNKMWNSRTFNPYKALVRTVEEPRLGYQIATKYERQQHRKLDALEDAYITYRITGDSKTYNETKQKIRKYEGPSATKEQWDNRKKSTGFQIHLLTELLDRERDVEKRKSLQERLYRVKREAHVEFIRMKHENVQQFTENEIRKLNNIIFEDDLYQEEGDIDVDVD